MNGIEILLKAVGVKVSSEVLAQTEAMLPQLPTRINEAIQFILQWQRNFDTRLKAIEATQVDILEKILGLRKEVLNGRTINGPGSQGGNRGSPAGDGGPGGDNCLN